MIKNYLFKSIKTFKILKRLKIMKQTNEQTNKQIYKNKIKLENESKFLKLIFKSNKSKGLH